MRGNVAFLALVLIIGLAGCAKETATPTPTEVSEPAPTATEASAPTATATVKPTEVVAPFAITSPAFDHEAAIPEICSCDGENISPALSWTEPPAGTQSFALICDDPDAPGGTWVHWVVYNVSADARGLPEAVADDAALPDGVHGENSWGRTDYGGPCPPSGTHRYFFKLYALDTALTLEPGASKAQVLDAMEGHILAEVELTGTYARK